MSHILEATGVIPELITEYDRAKAKHGPNTLDGARSTDLLRLAALVEEVGEVARELTYDHPADPATLRHELIQVANVAITWASILPVEREKTPEPRLPCPAHPSELMLRDDNRHGCLNAEHISSGGPYQAITCSVCHMTSYSSYDIQEGYCGTCHQWTSGPVRGPRTQAAHTE